VVPYALPGARCMCCGPPYTAFVNARVWWFCKCQSLLHAHGQCQLILSRTDFVLVVALVCLGDRY
jgi:hypothetical protein